MTDIHSHILPLLDDGAGSMEEAVIMARTAHFGGVENIIATPHVRLGNTADGEKVRSCVNALNAALKSEGTNVKIYPGMEITACADTLRLLESGVLIPLNGSRYVLLEFGFAESGERISRMLADTAAAGYIPVVAHPERYACVKEDPSAAAVWMERGYVLQLERESILGLMGRRTARCAHCLLSRGWVHAVGSDAHGAEQRTAELADVQEYITLNIGYEYARLLLEENPQAILTNTAAKAPVMGLYG